MGLNERLDLRVINAERFHLVQCLPIFGGEIVGFFDYLVDAGLRSGRGNIRFDFSLDDLIDRRGQSRRNASGNPAHDQG